jgi:transglutaminase-like putative cysteine protease
MLIHIGYDLQITLTAPTPVMLLLDVHPSRTNDLISYSPLTLPGVEISRSVDFYGNRMQRFLAPAGQLNLTASGVIKDPGTLDAIFPDAREVPVADLPDYCLHYLAGSRYCETDELNQIAWSLFGNLKPGWTRVQAIVKFVHDHLRFSYPEASSTRTALSAYKERVGVCRDFAHLAIALCRCMNIPARYVNGYLGDIGVPVDPAPMDFSAWMEVYLDHRWITFDPRHNKRRTGRVVIARGRDAADVAMITTYGPHTLSRFNVITDEMPSNQPQRLRLTQAA